MLLYVCGKLWILMLELFQQKCNGTNSQMFARRPHKTPPALTLALTMVMMTRMKTRGRFHLSVGSGGVRKGGAADVATGKNPPLLQYTATLLEIYQYHYIVDHSIKYSTLGRLGQCCRSKEATCTIVQSTDCNIFEKEESAVEC